MNLSQENYRAVAISCGVLITFIGLVHEVIGPIIYPWAPGWFGPLLWNGMGILVIVLGILSLSVLFGKVKAPLVPIAFVLAVGSLAAVGLMVYRQDHFHFFAFSNSLAAITMAYCYRRGIE